MSTVKQKLDAIHAEVYGKFRYQWESLQDHGRQEYWDDVDEVKENLGKLIFEGDCDDFALHCRYLCREAGIETRLIFCQTETGENHLVLSSVLEDGTNAILDNRHPRVMTREELPGYKWMYMSGLNKGDPWHRIAG